MFKIAGQIEAASVPDNKSKRGDMTPKEEGRRAEMIEILVGMLIL